MTVVHSLRLLGCCRVLPPHLTASLTSESLCRRCSNYSPYSWQTSPFEVFAFALDLGNITSTPEPIVWSIGVVRKPVISYVTETGKSQSRAPYFLIEYNSISDAVSAP